MKMFKMLFGLTSILMLIFLLSGCGSEVLKKPDSIQIDVEQEEKEESDEVLGYGANWLIEVTETKNFTYMIPIGNSGSIDMTATLYFIAWKVGGEEMFGQYEGRALVAFNMDLSKATTGGMTFMGGAINDSISDNISFELIPTQQETITVKDTDIDLAPLVKLVGQAEIITDEYTISQQDWKALADGEVKLDVNNSFGDGAKNAQGFVLKVGADTVLISVNDFTAAYNLDYFRGTITKTESLADPHSWFREKVMSRMEERLSATEQIGVQQQPGAGYSDAIDQNALKVDSEGRIGMDINGDSKLEIYYGEDEHVWADFDGDGKYEIVGEEGSDK